MGTIRLLRGDITEVAVDAIVNAANSQLLGGGGVDGAIHRAAGPELLETCRKIPSVGGVRCPVGQAKITPGFNLPARFVIHTVGPRYRHHENPAQLLRLAHRSSLRLGLDSGCKSIAFPAISTGVYGYPPEEAAPIAVGECSQEIWNDMEIIFVLYDDKTLETWEKALG